MHHILIVEDNRSLQTELLEVLTELDYQVSVADDGAIAYQLLKQHNIDLCILDVGLPDCSGFDLCTRIRGFTNVPIIFLTARDEELDKVKGFQNGGDDYVTKPFSLKELLLRIEVQLRHRLVVGEEKQQCLYSGELEINDAQRKIEKNGTVIINRPIEFGLARTLIDSKGSIITREQLLAALWDKHESYIEDNTLTVHVSRLRKQLGTYMGVSYIETVRGSGYRWAVKVTRK